MRGGNSLPIKVVELIDPVDPYLGRNGSLILLTETPPLTALKEGKGIRLLHDGRIDLRHLESLDLIPAIEDLLDLLKTAIEITTKPSILSGEGRISILFLKGREDLLPDVFGGGH